MSQQTDIAVRRLIEMTESRSITWNEISNILTAEVDIDGNDYLIALGKAGSHVYVGVNGGTLTIGEGDDTLEADLYRLAQAVYCNHHEFLRDIGATLCP